MSKKSKKGKRNKTRAAIADMLAYAGKMVAKAPDTIRASVVMIDDGPTTAVITSGDPNPARMVSQFVTYMIDVIGLPLHDAISACQHGVAESKAAKADPVFQALVAGATDDGEKMH